MFNENGAFFKCIEEFIEGKTTLQDIEDFKNNYNIKLVNDYKDFLLKYNGVILGFTYEKNSKNYLLDNDYLEKIDQGYCELFLNLHQVIDEMNEYLGDFELDYKIDIVKNKKILPIALNSYGHNYLGIGYGKDNFGKIYTWYTGGFDGIFFVCDSFKKFIEGYYLIEANEDGEIIGTEKIFTIDNTI